MPDLTNEEKRVAEYRASRAPTVPAAVTPALPLADMNLNWTERDLPERERTKHVHRLHPYLGKYIPQLVEVFLRKFFAAGDTIYDPFVGSGTTLVQANELGMHAVGCDISAFNVLLCRVKTARYDLDVLKREVIDALAQVERVTQHHLHDLPLFSAMDAPPLPMLTDNAYLQRWFAPRALYELLTYRAQIERGGYEYGDVMRVILSRAARSARLTTHFDLDFPKVPQTEPYYCYKHSRMCAPTEEAFKFIRRYSHDTVSRIAEFAHLRTDARVEVQHGDSRTVELPLLDGVMTSPPYVGLIDYHEQHSYAFELLGLSDNRHREIGAAAAGSSKRAKTEYQAAMVAVFQQAVQALKPGGKLIVVAGDRHALYGEIATALGVEVVDVLERHVNRRTGRRAGEFYESVFIWQKR